MNPPGASIAGMNLFSLSGKTALNKVNFCRNGDLLYLLCGFYFQLAGRGRNFARAGSRPAFVRGGKIARHRAGDGAGAE